MSQNIYDNSEFFNQYMLLRKEEFCANDIEERPERLNLLPDLKNKSVLDLGCGSGDDCAIYVEMGAKKVVGIDISKKMILEAKNNHGDKDITFLNMDMESLSDYQEHFDVVVSSLAIHYVKDYKELCKNIYRLLNEGGVFLFSQEHPIFTATKKGVTWLKDIDENVIGMILENYPDSGERKTFWLVDGVVKYHRTIGEIVSSLIEAGFKISAIKESELDEEKILLSKKLSRCRHVPDYLFVRVEK